MSQRLGYLPVAHASGSPNKSEISPPYATEWEDLDLDTAMDMIADRVWETRDASFDEKNEDGEPLMHTLGHRASRRRHSR